MSASLATREALITLSSDELRVDVVATEGARVASLVDRRSEREWLSGPRATGAEIAGDLFTDTDHFGWDEMFPSVDACAYPSGSRRGEPVPDHGELWSSTWEVVAASTSHLHQRFRSERFGYVFTRVIDVKGPTLRATYSCQLNGDRPEPLLWALHPQFDMHQGSRVLLGGVRHALRDTSEVSNVHEVSWLGDLSLERDVAPGADRMLYATLEEPVEDATLLDASGTWLHVTWDRSFARYFGLWLDHGRHTPGRVVALEPTNGYYDELARAVTNGSLVAFAAGAATTWWVEMTVGRGAVPCKN